VRDLAILDFDIECRPIAFYGGDQVTKQPTVIAWKFIGESRRPRVAAIGESDRSSKVLEEEAAMIEAFHKAYDAADMVTGHFIRGFDLTTLNGAAMRLGIRTFEPKLAEDTKLDLVKAAGISKSMENLSAMLDAANQKISMNTATWADANMLLPHGIKGAKKRCVGDVIEHIELRELLIEAGLLKTPKMWRPDSGKDGGYEP
jgi:hypothetical protein